MKVLTAISVFFFCLGIISCKRTAKDLDILGKEYQAASADFKVLSVVRNRINDGYRLANSNSPLVYNMKFSQEVTWKITITSKATGAYQEFNGFSDTIADYNFKWRGSSAGYRFFSVADTAIINLTVLGREIPVFRDTINIINLPNLSNNNIKGVFHYLVGDFESGGNSFGTPYNDVSDDGSKFIAVLDEISDKVQGLSSFYFAGSDALNPNTYVGGCDTRNLYDLAQKFSKISPDSTYINLYIKGTEKKGTSLLLIVYEQDGETGSSFNLNINDKYQNRVVVDWVGWKLVSIPYSKFTKATSGGGLGNNELESDKISGFSIQLESYPDGGKDVEAYIDYVIFTQGKPFDISIIDKI